ncbi:hypothetical protein Hanom_Chr01g00023921 [Helianthus anomalus]
MHYRLESKGIPRVNVSIDFTKQEWYTVLTRKVTSIIQLKERALVAAGMSMWAPQIPRGFPVYGYKGKGTAICLLLSYKFFWSPHITLYACSRVQFNECFFDHKAGGAMVVASLPEGRPLWLDQIRDNFLHPSNESLAAYANTIVGDDDGDDIGIDVNPTREEPILLSSEDSDDDASYHLIYRSSREGPQRGPSEELAVEVVPTPVVDPHVSAAEPSEVRKKKKGKGGGKKS